MRGTRNNHTYTINGTIPIAVGVGATKGQKGALMRVVSHWNVLVVVLTIERLHVLHFLIRMQTFICAHFHVHAARYSH